MSLVTSENKESHDKEQMEKRSGVGESHHQKVLERMSKNIPDDVTDAAFGNDDYVYHTPYRPIENSQQTSIGGKINPIHERAFSSKAPINSDKLNKIEAVPVSENAIHHLAKEVADSGVHGMMHKDAKRFAVVMESTKGVGKHQVTEYDKSGAIGDSQHDDKTKAIHRMIEQGYRKILPKERVSSLIQKVMIH